MQITLNTSEVSDCVLAYVQQQLGLDDSNNFVVELNEDGITVLVNEDNNTPAEPTGAEKPARKPRQPRKPKEATTTQVTEAGNVLTTTVETATASEPVAQEAAGETIQEASESHGTEAEVEPEVDPSNAVDTTVAVEVAETVAAEQETQAEEEPPRKPTQSLFANLRKPNNG